MINIHKFSLLAKLKGKQLSCMTCTKRGCINPTIVITWEVETIQILNIFPYNKCFGIECQDCSFFDMDNHSCFTVCEHWRDND